MPIDNSEALTNFVVNNPDLERLEGLLAEFNIFEAIGAVKQELRHSDFLGYLLDPAGNHNLGDAFLKRLLKRVLAMPSTVNSPVSAVEIDVMHLDGATGSADLLHSLCLESASATKRHLYAINCNRARNN